MKHIIRLGMLSVAIVLSIVGNSVPVAAVGEESKHLMIAEVSPESATSASEEYIELFNPNPSAVDVTGWQLQYRSYSHPSSDNGSWSAHAILGCQSAKISECSAPTSVVIGPGDTLRLSSFETGDGIVPFEPGMATTGGEVRLVQPGTGSAMVVHDLVGYGTAKGYEGSAPATAPKPGRGIIRNQDNAGLYVDSDQNGVDLALTPDETADVPQEPGSTTVDNNPDQQPTDTVPKTYLDAEITEVLPDPVSPQADSSDEFIEIYNPYDQALDLTGYVLKTGTDWSHSYTIDQVSVDPFSYVTLMSAQTHLSLSNSGSGVRLYDPNGKLLFEAPTYGAARSGDSWIRNAQGQWVWTTKPTPGEANIVDAPVDAKTVATTTPKKTTTSKAASSAKKASTPKATVGAVRVPPQQHRRPVHRVQVTKQACG